MLLLLLSCLLQDRVSADPNDPEMQSLQQQLQLLGPAPRRVQLSHQQEMELWNWAEEEVAAGRVSERCIQTPPLRGVPSLFAFQQLAGLKGHNSAVHACAFSLHSNPSALSAVGWYHSHLLSNTFPMAAMCRLECTGRRSCSHASQCCQQLQYAPELPQDSAALAALLPSAVQLALLLLLQQLALAAQGHAAG
jgi:hypothetical protein